MTVSVPHTSPTARFTGACGLASALSMFVAPMLTGSAGAAIWPLGLVLVVPFLAGLAARVRAAEGPAALLAPSVLVAGATWWWCLTGWVAAEGRHAEVLRRRPPLARIRRLLAVEPLLEILLPS